MLTLTSLALLGLASLSTAHFVLMIPTSLGYDDEKESQAPCGSYNPLDRSTGVTDWPVGGHSVGLLSTHGSVTWEINAALISGGATTFVPLVLPFAQRGVGDVCFGAVPGNPAWVGQDAVVQLIQHAPDGNLYQVRILLPRRLFTDLLIILSPVRGSAIHCWGAGSRAGRLYQLGRRDNRADCCSPTTHYHELLVAPSSFYVGVDIVVLSATPAARLNIFPAATGWNREHFND
jgi:hypothetical protein